MRARTTFVVCANDSQICYHRKTRENDDEKSYALGPNADDDMYGGGDVSVLCYDDGCDVYGHGVIASL
ncbi:unnamed protein product [Echinostoma caproni]|uniref:Uncharacterized protein n=1 Tax=Echinostoma caproni TaxID=27848 RepID=A0A183AYL7_9TREM|nr:unnamed protein product [Echinostoma caproni]